MTAICNKTMFIAEQDESLSGFYEQHYQLFCELYPILKPFFAKASLLR
jgi:hypothetical protein